MAAPTLRPSLLPQYLVLLAVAALVLVPLVAAALGGFKSLGELRVNPLGLPSSWDGAVYGEILGSRRLWRMLLNSAVIAGLTVGLVLIVGSMAAFVFAHVVFFGSRMLLNYMLLGLMFPAATAMLPLFIRVRDLGLLDTYWGVVLPQVAFGLGMAILMLRGFFRQLPYELWEAARVDGCGYFQFYLRVTLPLSRPILATVAVFALVASWNNYLLPLIMFNAPEMYPWPLGIMNYQGEYSTEWNKVLAFVTLTLAPAIVFFLVAQRHIVAGLAKGAVKG
ncbi:carbohydrate ABC transporter permease [Inquilinus limosus]|uniref:carbohydrate ABC transporter permease n=1 Tax=Inquilinus limosus TaxID=171674 RepID=UPI00040141DC|nr:carbohydrate ABC transporter permease [Inquilinus limosus]